jgi:protein-disulfide isomerase
MEQTSTGKRFLTWGIFVVIVGLIIWGLVAAQQKALREEASLVLPGEIVATDHTMGSTEAPVTLVEYGDFECPACATYHPLVKKVLASYGPNELRFVFRHFPLQQHKNAIPAALAAEAAGKQGKFWEMYNILYEKQDEWTTGTSTEKIFAGYAGSMGLDLAKFAADQKDKELLEHIYNDFKGGVKAGINSTPTFFINGKKIPSPQGYDEFKKVIDDALPEVGA